MTEIDYAYIAGLIDGEGTISLISKGKNTTRQPQVSISSTTYELLSYCKETFGGGCICKHKKTKMHHKDAYSWRMYNDSALDLLSRILVYMKEPEKVRKGLLLINNYKKFTRRNGWYTQAELLAKEELEKEFFQNNPAVKLLKYSVLNKGHLKVAVENLQS